MTDAALPAIALSATEAGGAVGGGQTQGCRRRARLHPRLRRTGAVGAADLALRSAGHELDPGAKAAIGAALVRHRRTRPRRADTRHLRLPSFSFPRAPYCFSL